MVVARSQASDRAAHCAGGVALRDQAPELMPWSLRNESGFGAAWGSSPLRRLS